MGKIFALKQQQNAAIKRGFSVNTSAADKLWTEITNNKMKTRFSNERKSRIYSSCETSRKQFCGGEEHDEGSEKRDSCKDELSCESGEDSPEHVTDVSVKWDSCKDELSCETGEDGLEHITDVSVKWDSCKDELSCETREDGPEHVTDTLVKWDGDLAFDITFHKQVGKNAISSTKNLTDKYTKTASGTSQLLDNSFVGSIGDADGHIYSSSCMLECQESSPEGYEAKAADADHVCSYPSSMGFQVDKQKGVEEAYPDYLGDFNYNTDDSSFDFSKHFSSLMGGGSVYSVSQHDRSLISSMTDTNLAGLTTKEIAKMMVGLDILKCNNVDVPSKDLVNWFLKFILRCQDTGLSKLEKLNKKDMQYVPKEVVFDETVVKNAMTTDQEKGIMEELNIENGLERDLAASNTAADYEDHKNTANISKRKTSCEKDGKRTSIQDKKMVNVSKRKTSCRKDATFAVQLPAGDVMDVRSVTYKVRARAEGNSSGRNSGGLPAGTGGGWSGRKQNSDKDDFSDMSGHRGSRDGDDKDTGDSNVNRQTEPTRPLLNLASLPPKDYKAYKKKHSSASVGNLCDILGTLGLDYRNGITISDSLLSEVDHCLVVVLHNVTQQPVAVTCDTCNILHSLMKHFVNSNHPYMTCPHCRQIFHLMQWHIIRCTAGEIGEQRSSSDLCFQIARDPEFQIARNPEFQSSLVEHPEQLWCKLLKYLGAVLCPSDFYCTVSTSPDSSPEMADVNSITTGSDEDSFHPPTGFGILPSPLPSIPEDEGISIVRNRQPLTRKRSQPQSSRPPHPAGLNYRATKSIGALPTHPTTAGASRPAAALEPLDSSDNAMPLIDPITQEPLLLSDKSPQSSLESGSVASASGAEGPSVEQIITEVYWPRLKNNKPIVGMEPLSLQPGQDDPYTTQTKTYGGHGLISLPVNPNAGSRGSHQLLSLEMRPVGEPGIGEVVYGTRSQLLKVGKSWTQIKSSVERTGDLYNQRREEGVILAESRETLRILRTRYQKHHQWQRLVHLANGMSGKCHLAQDVTTKFRFCVKQMHILQYEETELEIWSKVEHPNIVKLFGAIRKGRKIYFFSEFIDGGSLTTLIDDYRSLNRRISHWMALRYLRQLLQVLKYLKEKNVVHEDLKSDNILLRRNTTVIVLTDFGLARWFNKEQELQGRPPTGSQPYWSPEKAASMGHGFASDLWAAICILVHMLSGYPPWTRRFADMKWLHYVIFNQSPPLQDVPENIQTAVQELFRSGFVCNPRDRPQVENLLQHQAFRILDQGAPDTCYSVLVSSGGQMPNNVLPEGQGEGQDIEEILHSFQQEEPTNNLSIVRPSDEQTRSIVTVSWNIPGPGIETQAHPVTEVQGQPVTETQGQPDIVSTSEPSAQSCNDPNQEASASTTGTCLPRNQRNESSDTVDTARPENLKGISYQVLGSCQTVGSHQVDESQQVSECHDDNCNASDSDCESEDLESIRYFYEDDNPTTLQTVRPKLQPYRPDPGATTTTTSVSGDKMSLLQLINQFASENQRTMDNKTQTTIIQQQNVSGTGHQVGSQSASVGSARPDDVSVESGYSASRCSVVGTGCSVVDINYEPVVSGDLFGSDPEKQLREMNQPQPNRDHVEDEQLQAMASAATSIDDQLMELKHRSVSSGEKCAGGVDVDLTAASTNRREQPLRLNVGMTPKKTLRETLSAAPLEFPSNLPAVHHSETSPASLAHLVSKRSSPKMTTVQQVPGSDSSGHTTPASSDSRHQVFSEANPSTPCSQYDQQQKEFSDVFRELSESGLSVENTELLNDRLNIEMGPSEDQMMSVQLSCMQQEISISEDMGVPLYIMNSNGEELRKIMVPHVYEDWRSIADMVRKTVHNAGINHFSLKYPDDSEIDFHAKLDKKQMQVVVSEIADDGNHNNCWCEDHEDNFRGMI